MTNTTNYNLLLAEGTDLVNYLTQTNPNFSNLDTIIKGVSDLTVTPATEVTTGTAHAISRSLPDATVIKFTATSNWQTGDTMTLDGNPVTPLKTDGTTLKTGDYIIGSAVLMIQDGTRLTVLVASSPDAGDINYDNTVSGLASNKVQGAVDELAADVNTINSNLSQGSYSTSGLFYTNCSYDDGGYVAIGNLVNVNIKVTALANGVVKISGLPRPSTFAHMLTACTVMRLDNNSNPSLFARLYYDGDILVDGGVANGVYAITCTYLKA